MNEARALQYGFYDGRLSVSGPREVIDVVAEDVGHAVAGKHVRRRKTNVVERMPTKNLERSTWMLNSRNIASLRNSQFEAGIERATSFFAAVAAAALRHEVEHDPRLELLDLRDDVVRASVARPEVDTMRLSRHIHGRMFRVGSDLGVYNAQLVPDIYVSRTISVRAEPLSDPDSRLSDARYWFEGSTSSEFQTSDMSGGVQSLLYLTALAAIATFGAPQAARRS